MMLRGILFHNWTSKFSKPGVKKKFEMLVENKRIIFTAALWSVYHRFPVDQDVLLQTLPSWFHPAEL